MPTYALSHHFIDGDIASLFFDLFAFCLIYCWCQGVWFFSWSEWWAYGFAMRRWNAKAHYFDRLKNQLGRRIIDLNWCNSKIAIRIFQIVVSDRFIHSLTLNFVTWLVLRRFVQALNPFCSAILEMWGSFWIGVRYEWLSVDIGKKSLWM